MSKTHTLLVVDDSPDNLRILGQLLEEAGYEIAVAISGAAALERAGLDPAPDLILLDIVMPGMDGFEVLRRLKATSTTSGIPVILISGIADAEKKIQGFKQGAVDYITKPFQAEEVVARVGTHIQLTRIEQLQHEIVERERSEAALRQSEAILKKAQKVAHIGSWTWDIATDKLEWSDEMFSIFGLSKERFSGDLRAVVAQAIHPEDRAKVEASNQAVATESRPEPMVYRVVHPDGRIRTVWAEPGELLLDENGAARVLTGIVQDITERVKAVDALRSSEERYRSLLLTAMDGFWLSDLDGRIVETNQAYCEMTGYSSSELVGRSISALEAAESPLDVAAHVRLLVAKGWDRFRTRHRRKDGSLLELEISANFWPGDGGRAVAFLRDITAQVRAESERAELEAQLQQAQKLESIGRLAGGVAHDFNNMLGVIQGHAELAMLDLPEDSQRYHSLETILEASRKSAGLTRQLLAFARKEVVAPRILDLNESTSGILAMLRRLIGENVQLQWAPCPGLWPVLIDPSQFDQILANLCLNARDAISGSGRIAIGMHNRVVGESEAAGNPELVGGEFVEVSISDTGCGMDTETLSRIFEPFFTTKGLGKGTGLGLATVYGAVKQNQGFIEVRSVPGSGTTFLIRLPRREPRHGSNPGAPLDVDSCRHETILLVEDDLNLLDLAKSMLEASGYRVLAAHGPDKALELAREHGDSIQLLVSDVVMPGMNGRELSKLVRAVVPCSRHLYVSGYTADIIANQGILDKGVNFLQKPFSIKELARKVREVLDQDNGRDSSMA